jgi:ribosome-associated toxin RatA of RatAB toxin-antitoxin module
MGEIRQVQRLLWCVCCLMSTAVAGPAGDAAAADWTLVRRVEDVELYRSPVTDSDMPALRGHTRFPATAGDVFRVISDYDHFAGFIPLVSESRIVERDARTTWVYQRLGLPLPVTDRHYIIKVVNDLHAVPAGAIDVDWQLDPVRSKSLSSKDALLPDALSGSWHLEPLAGQTGCDAVYTIHVEPGGTVPDWLFVRVTEHYVIEVMDAVRKRIAVNSR